MTTSLAAPLPLQQVFNFRDLGGITTRDGAVVRSGSVYRADGLQRLGVGDREVLAGLGLRTIVDLRTERELDEWGAAPDDVHEAALHHLPLITTTWDMERLDLAVSPEEFLRDRYLEMVEEGAPILVEILELLADADRRALVFHCAAGKDRTGVLAAFLLSVLDVDDETIAADYARSAGAMDRMEAWYRENFPERIEAMTTQPAAFRSCPPEAMLLFLDAVRERWGSVDACLADAGHAPQTTAALRSQLLV
ncbi:MAG: tyrosine-protein phosphatase [Actinomycetota bacterium]